MSTADALVQAIRERIAAGLTKEEIQTETIAAGHKPEIFEAAYMLASSDTIESAELPSVHHLFVSSLQFVRKEWRLAVALALPLVVLTLSELVTQQYQNNSTILSLSALVGLVSLLVYAGLILISLQAVTQQTQTIDFKMASQWAKKNFLAALWLYTLMMIVIWGGIVLFIIPGVIAGITLYFAQYALVHDGAKGEQALLSSRQLVRGRWLSVAGKIFGLSLLFLLLIIIIMILGGLAVALASLAVDVPWWGDALAVMSQLVSAVVSLATLYAGNQLYIALKTSSTSEAPSKTPYRMLAVIGAASIVALISLVIYLVVTGVDMTAFTSTDETTNQRAELLGISITASAYRLTNNNSFEGVCALLTDSILSTSEITCNDEASAWALTTAREGNMWCVDSTGYNKSLEASLDGRTVCLPL